MNKQLRKFTYTVTAFLLVTLFILSFVASSGISVVYAATSGSNVLDDLRKDNNFKTVDYQPNDTDYSLNVIQIAESTDGELLIYVYQPSGQKQRLKASSINIAREMDNSTGLGFNNYKLKYINSTDVFFKYKVLDFELRSDAVRYYNISNILRPYDSSIDEAALDGNSISEVENAVGQFWTVCTVGDDITYTMTDSEVIEIPKKYVGYVQYSDGVNLGWTVTNSATVAHFVAFSTDKPIDKLMEADVYFCEREINAKLCTNVTHLSHNLGKFYDYEYGAKIEHEPVTVKYSDKTGNVGGGNIVTGNKYTWNRIQSTKDFIADQNNADYKLTNPTSGKLDGTQWVLSFHETQIEAKSGNLWLPLVTGVIGTLFADDADVKSAEVSDVMILRLKFEREGKVYNLGVVDNKQTNEHQFGGSEGFKPDNQPTTSTAKKVQPWVWAILALLGVIAVIAAVVILCILCPPAAKGIATLLKYIATGLWYIISAPFRWIAKRKEAAPAKAKSKSKSKSRAGKSKKKLR
ncbi:MAG: hypothetical protein K2O44_01760 [Clostridia bacterium]|nr:hypothetical protein [Clostridia bacterium]